MEATTTRHFEEPPDGAREGAVTVAEEEDRGSMDGWMDGQFGWSIKRMLGLGDRRE